MQIFKVNFALSSVVLTVKFTITKISRKRDYLSFSLLKTQKRDNPSKMGQLTGLYVTNTIFTKSSKIKTVQSNKCKVLIKAWADGEHLSNNKVHNMDSKKVHWDK